MGWWNTLGQIFKKNKKFPANILVTAPHGTAKIPLEVYKHLSPLYKTSPRLLLNFSDYGTKYLIEKIPDAQKEVPKYGRLIGDPNRSVNAPDIIRFKDFGGNNVFSEKFEKRLTDSIFRVFWRNKMLRYSYKPFFKSVFKKLDTVANHTPYDKPVIHVDVHDTGNRLLGRKVSEDTLRETPVPKIILSNAPTLETGEDIYGTAPMYFLEAFADLLAENMSIDRKDIYINHIFQGANMIRTLGNPKDNAKVRKSLHGRQIFSVQIEFDRGLYLNEKNQLPYVLKLRRIRKGFYETLCALGNFDF
ncbi:hypothetical protein CSB37_00640 [bacterium DOLZORAL124_38_8]|nr:MAG: hypothetical protein CSB37_00640 [bacterium DOLZORAL124_38_8]